MPRLPVWLVILVASLVSLFGLFRIKLAFRSAEEEARARSRGGLYGYGRRQQFLFGLVYLILGVLLFLGAFGLKMPWQR